MAANMHSQRIRISNPVLFTQEGGREPWSKISGACVVIGIAALLCGGVLFALDWPSFSAAVQESPALMQAQ